MNSCAAGIPQPANGHYFRTGLLQWLNNNTYSLACCSIHLEILGWKQRRMQMAAQKTKIGIARPTFSHF